MNFIDALGYLYHNRTSDEEFTDPFFLYCRMSDLCSSSYEDKRKVLLFYQVNKKLDMVRSILNKDETVASRHKEVADLLSDNGFYKLLESVKCVVFPDYKREEKPKPKPQPQKKAAVQAVITNTEESQEEETRTPLTSSYVGGGDTDVIIGLSIIGGVILAIGLFILFACVFNWSWAVWQWLVGIVGGILLSAILGGIVAWLDEECLADYYVLGFFVLGICTLINFILLLIFRGNYRIIFGCYSVIELLGGLILVFPTFDDCEEGWGGVQIVEIFVNIALFVVGLIWL